MNLKLGIIGLSDGNGHPYSWSAIFNGYDPEAMELCGFPVIPRYLEQQNWPASRINGADVVVVWTQKEELSQKIAKAARIPRVVSTPEEMIGMVDAVLLARDDAENHLEFAAPFIKAGLPIYIDKPIALSVSALDKLYELEQYPGQIFTCSALRYSAELMLTEEDRRELGEIRKIVAFTPKSWSKYAVHIIEPVLNMLPQGDEPVSGNATTPASSEDDASGTLLVGWRSGVQTAFFATGDGLTPISVRVIGTKGYKDLNFTDSFSAFKAALEAFVGGIRNREVASPKTFNTLVVELLERGKA
ncbi:Gfo/Idh/MocA family protein [Marinobacter sp. F3R11]|uniref:Gfo/Idh/MocA family protein n=1 Tax=Marinobacter sp. F3R11 TaxID=2267231 RepID=UPI0016513C78|nr:Gfo/Idh/MocA family oxidoreductase [Marinobacter sp. F3R11]